MLPLDRDPLAQAELRKTLELVLADVASWDQTVWGVREKLTDLGVAVDRFDSPAALTGPGCRTAYCVAGHYAVSVAGYVPIWYRSDASAGSLPLFTMAAVEVPADYPDAAPGGDGGHVALVEHVARRAFGLDRNRADELFRDRNSLRRVLDLAYHYSGGAVDLLDRYAEVVAADPDFAAQEREVEERAAFLDHSVVADYYVGERW